MRRFAASFCALLLLTFGVLSFSAAVTKNSTYDETLHVPAAWANLHGDFRVNPEHPPLWKYWCALPQLFWPIDTSGGQGDWAQIPTNFAEEWNWGIDVLYHTPGNNADHIVARARFMMLLLALGLGAMLMAWSWRQGGAIGAIVAGVLYCFDPNFLAHGSLVTNDVATTFCFFAWMWAIWKVGREATPARILIMSLLCGTAMVVKFSGMLLGPITVLLLIIRALGGPWRVGGRSLQNRSHKIFAALAISAAAAVVSYAIIWAAYGFRYSAIPSGKESLAWNYLLNKTQVNELYAKHPGSLVLPAEQSGRQGSWTAGCALFARDHHLLPEAFCYGVLFVRSSGLVRNSYLLGQISPVGWWYYFPLSILFKTPTATLVACLIAVLVGWSSFRKWRPDPETRWLALVLTVPAVIYLLVVMGANLDLGIRHILEIYPPIYLATGLAAARIMRNKNYLSKIAAGILGLLLVAESASAWPNFIPFFNFPSGGWRNGINLLGDSNLDWGQDLKSLGQWQQTHRNKKLYLLYFGTADPAYYGIHYTNLPGSYVLGPLMEPLSTPGIIAVSATAMQGIYMDDAERQAYSWMLHAQPIEVLGGSIYLFEYPYAGRWK